MFTSIITLPSLILVTLIILAVTPVVVLFAAIAVALVWLARRARGAKRA